MSDIPRLSSQLATNLYRKFCNRTARVGVIGLGYVGLPLAVELGCAGFNVTGIDVDRTKCDGINRGESHIDYVPADVLKELVTKGRFRAVPASGLDQINDLDAVSICVPTPLRSAKEPDLSYVIAAGRTAKSILRPGMLVVLESTTYPGTTDEVLRGILEETGMEAGVDFFLSYSPERIDPGLPDSVRRPRVVGGLTEECSALAAELYKATSIDRVVPVSSTRAAEMAKLLENTFRAVNIGLANEMALMCEHLDIDVWEVIDAAATKPAGFMAFYPGPGLGGHCIPVDPFYLSWKVREFGLEARLIELAGQLNSSMPSHVVGKVTEALNSQQKAVRGSKVLVLGVAYKADVNDIRESPALDVIGKLLRLGGKVTYHDPFVPKIAAADLGGNADMDSVRCTPEELAGADCVVILANHSTVDYEAVLDSAQMVVDTRRAIQVPSPKVFRLGAPNASGL
ncbi:nucleotide sugar dehydrogenase [Mycolicibacterium sp.]|uniref:nucleotide sugar dehydrogenase n=1 Tax=Mycolicibacterium sp. TaxID=2320850 RepID=UPI0025EB3B6B|nr:nucleotide sugar dehydrogenase [Mycolicibacterium sp.]MCB9409862.1 nucleotide sugar dehydrogenase [Mycolicibacterium sp.]